MNRYRDSDGNIVQAQQFNGVTEGVVSHGHTPDLRTTVRPHDWVVVHADDTLSVIGPDEFAARYALADRRPVSTDWHDHGDGPSVEKE
jgi:hypothetical protein